MTSREHRTGVREAMCRVMGSIPVGDSDFFFVPRSCHVDEFAIYTTRIFTSHTSVIAPCTQPGNSRAVSFTFDPGCWAMISHHVCSIQCQVNTVTVLLKTSR